MGKLGEIVDSGSYKVIVLPESIAVKASKIREKVIKSGKYYPVFVIIPGFEGPLKERVNEIYQLINLAVGVKLKYGG